MSTSLQDRLALRLAHVCAAASLAALAVPFAHAQLPSVVAYGARVAILNPTNSTSGTMNKVTRDLAGNIFYYQPATNAIIELPISGPAQIAVPSTDPALTNANAGFTPRLASDSAGNLFIAQYTYSFSNVMYEVPRNANGTYGTSVVIATGFGAINNFYYTVNDLAVDGNDDIYAIFGGYGIAVITSNASNTNGTNAHFVVGSHAVPMTTIPTSLNLDLAGNLFYADGTAAWEITAAGLTSAVPTPAQIGSGMTTPKFVYADNAGNLYVANGSSTEYVIVNNGSPFTTSSPTYALPGTVTGHSGYTYGVVDNQGNLFADFGGSLEYYGGGKIYVADSPYAFGGAIPVGTASATTIASGPSVGLLFTSTVTLNATTPFIVSTGGAAYGAASLAATSVNATSGNTTCVAGTTYTAGQTCGIEFGLSPKQPGAFTAAVQVLGGATSAATNLLTTVYVDGIASGPAVTIDTGVKTTIGTGYVAPAGIAVDNTGAMYVADSAANVVFKYAAGSTSAGTAFGTGLSGPSGTAIDASGDLFIADSGNNRVVYLPNVNGTFGTQTVLNTGTYTLSSPRGVAVDGFGNIYIADTGNARVLMLPNPVIGTVGSPVLIGAGYVSPYGIAIDALNDVFVADKGGNAVYEIPGGLGLTLTTTVNKGPSAQVKVGSGLNAPTGVAVDGSGSVYVADGGNSRVVKIPSIAGVVTTASQTVLLSSIARPAGIATDLSADLYVTDVDLPAIYFVQRSAASGGTAATLGFGSVVAGATSTQTGILSNAGYTTSLTEAISTAAAAPFAQGTATSTDCASASPLTAGASCNFSLTFTSPATVGTASTGSFILTDNELNGTAQTTKVALTGYTSGPAVSVALAGDTTVTYGETETYMVTAKDSAGNPSAAANGTYTVSITGTATSSASVNVAGGTGTFFLPSLGVGSYSLAVSVNGTAATPLSVTVTKAPLTVTAATVSKIFDTVNPALSLAYVGLVNGDSASVVTGTAPTLSTTATRVSPTGSYPIAVTGGTLTAANYTLTNTPGTLTITGSAPQAILFPALPNFTHGTAVTLTATTTSGLPVSYSVSGGTVSGAVLTIGAAGTVTVVATQPGSSSYAPATTVTRSFTAQ